MRSVSMTLGEAQRRFRSLVEDSSPLYEFGLLGDLLIDMNKCAFRKTSFAGTQLLPRRSLEVCESPTGFFFPLRFSVDGSIRGGMHAG